MKVWGIFVLLALVACAFTAPTSYDDDADDEQNALVVSIPKATYFTAGKTADDTQIRIKVTDRSGKFATAVHVFVTKVYPVSNPKQILVSNIEARADPSDNTLYSVAVFSRPELGVYALELSVTPLDKKSPFAPVNSVVRTVKYVTAVELTELSLRIVDANDEHDGTTVSLAYPETTKEVAKVNLLQTVVLAFRLQSGGRPVTAEQAFLKFTNTETHNEVVFPAVLQGKKYKIAVPLRDHVDLFRGHSSRYSLTLLIGDSLIHNPINWEMGSVNIHFGKAQRDAEPSAASTLPEIVHKFRPAEHMPPKTVSLAFTAMTVAPLLIFLIGLIVTGANLSKLPFTNVVELFYALGFQASVGGILGLMVIYWLRLNMMQTLQYLLFLGIAAVFFGHRALRYLASVRLAAHTKQE